jgi:outer membrane protein assembly factor BamD (BamD/ComL family)
MAGIAYLKLGNADKAAQKFQELLQKFPGSEYAGKARKLLKSIRRDVIS